jgi:hypothetical protein
MVNILQAVVDRRLLRPAFRSLDTWRAWLVFLKTFFGLPPKDEAELGLMRECTGLEAAPLQSREGYIIAGRRSGKSFMSAIIACWLAGSRDWRKTLGRGETGHVFILSVDKAQSKIIRGYVGEILRASPTFSRLVKDELQEEIRLRNGVTIAVKTASWRSVRGYTVLAAVLEELAFWRSEDSANPDIELIRAIKPALATVPDSLLIGISTPYSRRGALWEAFKAHYGKPGGPLVWKAASTLMNPTLRHETVEAALAEDPQAARAEWLAEFREDIETFIGSELVESLVIPGREELPKLDGVSYAAFCDPSGGRQDSFTLAIAHRDETGRVILDCLRERKPPFSAEDVVSEYSETLAVYGLERVTGDKYAGEWPRQAFEKHGVVYVTSERTASELYIEALPILTSGGVELVDSKRLRSQLVNLERRTRPGGRDQVGHSPGSHDDLANAVAGAILAAAKGPARAGRVYFSGKAVSTAAAPKPQPQAPRKGRVFCAVSRRPRTGRALEIENLLRPDTGPLPKK